MQNNPLYTLAEFPQFSQIRPDHAVPAIRALIAEAETKVAALEANCTPTWDGRIVALRDALHPTWRTWGVISHMTGVCNSDAWREAEETLQPEIVAFATRVMQSRPLYDALIALSESAEYATFDEAHRRIIESEIRSARNSGVGLDGAARERFNEILQDIAVLSMDFSNHVLDATKEFSLPLHDASDIAGLPDSLLEACALAAKEAGENESGTATAADENKSGTAAPWRVTLESAILVPFMQYSERRDLREKLYRANIAKASQGKLDNRPLIEKILALRTEMAALLGYRNYAEMSLSAKMAQTPDAVFAMFDRLDAAAMTKAREELDALNAFAKENGFTSDSAASDDRLMNWDVAYWSRRQVEALFGYSPETLRPYFQLEKVLDGLFALVGKLSGVRIEPADGVADVWHPDVRFFRVLDEKDETVAWFYLDPYSRPATKRGGAWMNEFQTRHVLPDGTVKLPIALMVCNQSVPSGGKPSCMTPLEVSTLFHEFGHATQNMLTRVGIPEVSGINNIEWDAVELASQFLENWCGVSRVLKSLSCHVDTGAPLPDETLARIRASETHHAALHMARQLGFGLTDMLLHTRFPSEQYPDIAALERAVAARFSPMPPLPEDRFLCSFAHIFAGGYAAGYYSYMWADVLAADAFDMFEEAGIDDDQAVRELGRRYTATILADGGARPPLDVFTDFRGRAPDTHALLKQKGLA